MLKKLKLHNYMNYSYLQFIILNFGSKIAKNYKSRKE